MTKIAKSGQNVGGPTQWHSDPRSGEGPCLDEGFLHRSMAEREHFAILGFAAVKLLFITHKFICFVCFVIPSFRGLVYWINEDPISVYKGPFMLKM